MSEIRKANVEGPVLARVSHREHSLGLFPSERAC